MKEKFERILNSCNQHNPPSLMSCDPTIGTVCKYVKQLSFIRLNIRSMSEEDSFQLYQGLEFV